MISLPDIPENLPEGLGDFLQVLKNKLETPEEIQLKTYSVQELESLTAKNYAYRVVRCTNGDAGAECIAYCDGFAWYAIELKAKVARS
jgi:hypothetical protein